jgi:hypothetical protein
MCACVGSKVLSQQQEIEQLSRRRTQCNKKKRRSNYLKIIVLRQKKEGDLKKKGRLRIKVEL